MADVIFNTENLEETCLGKVNFTGVEASLRFFFVRPSIEVFADVSEETLKDQCTFPVTLEFESKSGRGTENVYFFVDRSSQTACFFTEREESGLVKKLFGDDVVNFPYSVAEKFLEKQVQLTKSYYLDDLKKEVERCIKEVEYFVAVRFFKKEKEKDVKLDEEESPSLPDFLTTVELAEKELKAGRFVILPYRLKQDKDFFMEVVWNLFEKNPSTYYYLKLEDVVSCYLTHPIVKHLHLAVRACFDVDPAYFYDLKLESFESSPDVVLERYYLTKKDVKFLTSQFRRILETEKEKAEKLLSTAEEESKNLGNVLGGLSLVRKRIFPSVVTT